MQIEQAAIRNVKVILAVGQKLPRWPECYIPGWAAGNQDALLKYIETNPVRANLVSKPEEYPWSSAKNHILTIKNNFVKDIYYIREKYDIFGKIDYREYLQERDDKYKPEYFYKFTLQGRPIGKEEFIENLEKIYNVKFPKRMQKMDLSLSAI